MNIKRNFIALLVVLVLIITGILTRAPWLKDEEVRNIVRSNKNFQEQHPAGSEQTNPEIYVFKIPFGRWVTTYEGGWFVWFWQSGT